MERYFIVADDFTGSNDTGVQLTRRGVRTKVVLSPSAVADDGLSYVLDTESRNMPGEDSRRKTAKLLEGLDLRGFDCVIKKVDSTLRGNLAEEIQETDRVYGSELIVFMPALPGLGRATEGGVHKLNGVRIGDTELAKDPRKPVLLDEPAKILASVYDEPVGSLQLEQIRSGAIGFEGARLWACDAASDTDMRDVIAAARKTGKRVLWVGTAAIADNLLADEHPMLPAMAVICSVSDVARRQIRYAESKGLTLLQVDVPALLRGADAGEYVERALNVLRAGRDLALISSASYDRAELEASVAAGAALSLSGEQVAEFASSEITRIADEILKKQPVSGLFLSGGDTAIHFFERVGAGGSEIVFELTVGIPMMRLSGGRLDGLKVVTKAGAFGSEDALPMILRKLGEA